MKKYLYNIYFNFCSDIRFTKIQVETQHFLQWWHPIDNVGCETLEWIQNRHTGAQVTRLSRTLLEDLFQEEEDVEYSHVVFLILLPRSLCLRRGGLTQSIIMAVESENWDNTNFGASRKMGVGVPFWFISLGVQCSSWTLGSHVPVILIGFVIIKYSKLVLCTNPSPWQRYQTKDCLDWAGARGIYWDQSGTLSDFC